MVDSFAVGVTASVAFMASYVVIIRLIADTDLERDG